MPSGYPSDVPAWCEKWLRLRAFLHAASGIPPHSTPSMVRDVPALQRYLTPGAPGADGHPPDGAPFGVPAAENKSQSAPDPKGPTSAKEDFGYMAAPSRHYPTLGWVWHNLRCEGVEGLMGGDGDVAVRVPRLLVTRLRVLLARRHKQRAISQRMVEREIVRRLRVSFAIDDLVEDHSDG